MEPIYVLATVASDGALFCGSCGSGDDWIDTQTDVGCARCGALLPRAQHDAFYDYEV